MSVHTVLLSLCLIAPTQFAESEGSISGIALNGTLGLMPLANCPIVLRASQDGSFVPIAETTTDYRGRFSFAGLPADGKVIYLPGANRHEVHYPGVRVHLDSQHTTAHVKLVAYDAVESPSPLISRRHEIEVRLGGEFLEVSETLVVDNPTLTTYVGTPDGEQSPVTLRLSLPEAMVKLTFDREFHGRNFQLAEKSLTTDLPWRPGKQELKFMYRLPADQQHQQLIRRLDQPTDHVLVRVVAGDTSHVTCNLSHKVTGSQGEAVFERSAAGDLLPAGHTIELQLGSLPMGFWDFARAGALVLLCVLLLGTVVVSRFRQRTDQPKVSHSQRRAA
jgi:hypothetical protein